MRKIIYYLVALSVIAAGCSEEIGRWDAKSPPAYLSISPTEDIFVSHEGISFWDAPKIKVNTDVSTWDWDTDVDELWCVTFNSNPDGYFIVTVRENKGSEERDAVITVSAKNAPPVYIKVHQGVTPVLTISPSSNQEVPYGGGTVSVGVRSIASWTAESDKSWAVVETPSGKGDGSVRISVDPNPGYRNDYATITFRAERTTQKMRITRGGDPDGIDLGIFQGGYRVISLDGGEIPITVTCNTSWTASSDQKWVKVGTTEGTGNGSSLLTVFAGTTPDITPANVVFRAGPITREVNIYRRVFVPDPDPDPDPDPGNKYKYVLEGYSTKVVYTISGNRILEGYSTKVVYTISGSRILSGNSTHVVYTISGDRILEGNSTRVVYTISGNRILEGYSTRVVYTLE